MHTSTAYTVTVDDPDLEQVSYTVHYRLPDSGNRYALWVQDESGWSQADFEIDGQYLLRTGRAEEITFCVTEQSCNLAVWIIAGTGCLLFRASLSSICAAFKRKWARRKPCRTKVQDTDADLAFLLDDSVFSESLWA